MIEKYTYEKCCPLCWGEITITEHRLKSDINTLGVEDQHNPIYQCSAECGCTRVIAEASVIDLQNDDEPNIVIPRLLYERIEKWISRFPRIMQIQKGDVIEHTPYCDDDYLLVRVIDRGTEKNGEYFLVVREVDQEIDEYGELTGEYVFMYDSEDEGVDSVSAYALGDVIKPHRVNNMTQKEIPK